MTELHLDPPPWERVGISSPAPSNEEIADYLLQNLDRSGITLIPLCQTVQEEELRKRFPEGPIFVCDCYVGDIELGESITGGFMRNGIYNIDHLTGIPWHPPAGDQVRFRID